MSGLAEAARAVADRERTSVELVTSSLEAIARLDGGPSGLNAFVEVHEAHALERAAWIDARLASGEPASSIGPLAGVPIAVKDNICVARGRTTAGSRMLLGYRSPYSATAVERLEAAGAIVIGKTNLDEFAMGGSGERSAHGATRHPASGSRVPGGSSSGSAAAVGSGMVAGALGSDTGGSIRQPASFCGIAGMKPTYGRVSRYGLIAFASSLDQIGPMATDVAGCALLLGAISGRDPRDATSTGGGPVWPMPSVSGAVRIGVPRDLAGAASSGVHPGVMAAWARAERLLAASGAAIVDVSLPHTRHAIAAYYIIAPAEASSNLARYDGLRYGHRAAAGAGESVESLVSRSRAEGFGEEVRRRVLLGTHALSSGYHDAWYLTALRARRLVAGDFEAAFAGGVDAILMPTTPGPAFRAGEKLDDPVAMYLEDVFTVGVNLAGLPSISVPAGEAEEGGERLPVGVQLVGRAGEDAALLGVAARLEACLGRGAAHASAG